MQLASFPGEVRRSMRTSLALTILVVSFGFVPAGSAFAQSANGIDGYQNYEQLTSTLRMYADHHGDIATLTSVGQTLEGRDIWVMEIASATDIPSSERPALLITAGLEGNQLVGSELALGIIHHLVDGAAENEVVKANLERYTYYVFPRLNPDGAEKAFAGVQSGATTNSKPVDDDNDGRTDEDGPDDLDGNGKITVMRVSDSAGLYMVDPDDERLMKLADPKKGEAGEWSIYIEGTDDDGDGFYNEDAVGGVNLNMNFQHEYPYYTVGAGPHMISEVETRALMDFVISHRNIAMMLTFGPHDNLVTAPNKKGELAEAAPIELFNFATSSNEESREVGMISAPQTFFFRGGGQNNESTSSRSSGRRPATTVNEDDQSYYSKVSKKYIELTGIKKAAATVSAAGAWFEYGYYQYGVPSFSTPGWGYDIKVAGEGEENDAEDDDTEENDVEVDDTDAAAADTTSSDEDKDPKKEDKGGDTPDHKLIAFQDLHGVDGFVEWAKYDHPTLGEVEIGGFAPFEAVNPPSSILEGLVASHSEFVDYLSTLFAEVRIVDTQVKAHGGGIYTVTIEVENAGFIPTSMAHGVVSRSVKPMMVQIGIPPENLLSGAAKTSFFQALDGSGTQEKFEWIIKGSNGDQVEIRVVSQKGGSVSAEVTLR